MHIDIRKVIRAAKVRKTLIIYLIIYLKFRIFKKFAFVGRPDPSIRVAAFAKTEMVSVRNKSNILQIFEIRILFRHLGHHLLSINDVMMRGWYVGVRYAVISIHRYIDTSIYRNRH